MPKDRLSSFPPVEFDPMTFKYNNTEFDMHSAKSKQFYSLLIANKAKYLNRFKTLSADLEISDLLQEVAQEEQAGMLIRQDAPNGISRDAKCGLIYSHCMLRRFLKLSNKTANFKAILRSQLKCCVTVL